MKINKLIISVFITIFMFLTACSSNVNKEPEPTPDTTDESTQTPVETPVVPTFGGTLRLTVRNPLTLNPLLNEDRSIDQILKLVFEPLFKIGADYKPVPNLVDSYNYDAANASVTLTLKSGLTFHNGEALTSDDVAYSIQVLQSANDAVIYKSCVNNIRRTSVIDDTTIKIYFKQPYAFSAYYLVFPILPMDYCTSNSYDAFKPVGDGLYSFVSFTSMQNIKLTAFDNTAVYVKDIDCTITRDEDVDMNSFNQNLTDMLTPSKFDWFSHSDNANQKVFSYTTNYFDFIGFNFDNSLLSNVKLRKAIAYAVNRETLIQNLFLSHAVISDSVINPNSWLMDGNDTIVYNYKTDESKTLLSEIPLTDSNNDGLLDQIVNGAANNITFNLLVNNEDDARMKAADYIKNDLAAIGITINIDAVDKTTFLTKLQAGSFDLVLTGWKLSYVPDFTEFFHSMSTTNGSNFIHYKNDLMDQALENVYTSSSDQALYDSIQNFNEIYQSELPYFSLYFMNSLVITNNDIYGQLQPISDNAYNGIENIYISRK